MGDTRSIEYVNPSGASGNKLDTRSILTMVSVTDITSLMH